jgi:hypothetical protein
MPHSHPPKLPPLRLSRYQRHGPVDTMRTMGSVLEVWGQGAGQGDRCQGESACFRLDSGSVQGVVRAWGGVV